jgi:hypothetical protein
MRGGITKFEAAPPFKQTVAAALMPILRGCVNAVRGPLTGEVAAKNGNATLIYGDLPFLHEEMRTAARRGAWGGEATERSERPSGNTGEIAPHISVNSR